MSLIFNRNNIVERFQGLIPQLITVVNKQINKKLRFGYDVGKGYITAEEEAQQLVDYMVEDKNIAKELKERVEGGRVQIIKGLGEDNYSLSFQFPCLICAAHDKLRKKCIPQKYI